MYQSGSTRRSPYLMLQISVLLAFSLLLASCGEEKKTLPKRGSTLLMITSADYPPFEYYQTVGKTREIVGYDVDLAKRIGQYLSYEIEFLDYDFPDILSTLGNKKAHFAMAGISVTAKRKKRVDFSKPYYKARNTLLLPKGSPLIREDEFNGKKIAVKLGSYQEQYAKVWAQQYKRVKLIPFAQDRDLIQAVISEKVDAAIVELTPGESYTRTHPESLTKRKLEDNDSVFAIAFPKGSPLAQEFDKALVHLENIGYLDELAQKWFKNGQPKKKAN